MTNFIDIFTIDLIQNEADNIRKFHEYIRSNSSIFNKRDKWYVMEMLNCAFNNQEGFWKIAEKKYSGYQFHNKTTYQTRYCKIPTKLIRFIKKMPNNAREEIRKYILSKIISRIINSKHVYIGTFVINNNSRKNVFSKIFNSNIKIEHDQYGENVLCFPLKFLERFYSGADWDYVLKHTSNHISNTNNEPLFPKGRELPKGNEFLEYLKNFSSNGPEKKLEIGLMEEKSKYYEFGITGSVIAGFLDGKKIEEYKNSDIDICISKNHYRGYYNIVKHTKKLNEYVDTLLVNNPEMKKNTFYRYNINGKKLNIKKILLIEYLLKYGERFFDIIDEYSFEFEKIDKTGNTDWLGDKILSDQKNLSIKKIFTASNIRRKIGPYERKYKEVEVNDDEVNDVEVDDEADDEVNDYKKIIISSNQKKTGSENNKLIETSIIDSIRKIIETTKESNNSSVVVVNLTDISSEVNEKVCHILRLLNINFRNSVKTHLETPGLKEIDIFTSGNNISNLVNTFHIPHVRGYFNLYIGDIFLTHTAYLAHKFGVFLPNKHYEVPTTSIETIVGKYRQRGIMNLMDNVMERYVIKNPYGY